MFVNAVLSPLFRKRLFPESKILHWFVQIALGLHYMHGRLVLHRDLKTQNIFLLGNGRLVLGDLGISKVRSSERPKELLSSFLQRVSFLGTGGPESTIDHMVCNIPFAQETGSSK